MRDSKKFKLSFSCYGWGVYITDSVSCENTAQDLPDLSGYVILTESLKY